jgi:hypothetical protein
VKACEFPAAIDGFAGVTAIDARVAVLPPPPPPLGVALLDAPPHELSQSVDAPRIAIKPSSRMPDMDRLCEPKVSTPLTSKAWNVLVPRPDRFCTFAVEAVF